MELYYREVVDEYGTYFKAFPIMRYICRKKRLTVSLLPYQLKPYTKYSIPFMFKILTIMYTENKSQKEILDYVANMGKEDILSMNVIYLKIFKECAEQAVSKVVISGYYPEIKSTINRLSNRESIIKAFVEFAIKFESTILCNPIRGPSALSFDYYTRGGGYIKDADFLFGTPSQKR